MEAKTKNICIITSSLGSGGAEKVAAIQSKMLKSLGYNIFVISVLNDIDYDYKGELLNLGLLKKEKDNFIYRIQRLFTLKKFIKKNKIDLIIDHRSRNLFAREFILIFFLYKKTKTVFVIHSYNLLKSFPSSKILANILYKKSNILVSVSKEIKKKVIKRYGFKNISNIYNAFEFSSAFLKSNAVHEDYILYFGRFDEDAKDLSFLVKAYYNSNLASNKIKLYLLGDGQDRGIIESLIMKLNLQKDVLFKPYTSNPFPIVENALFTVLTSNYEGFPMSIIESLACETPVVSVDCESGPKEVVKDKFNGLLVKKDLEAYTKALNLMISDRELLEYCKSNCIESIEHLSLDSIKKEWEKLIDNFLES